MLGVVSSIHITPLHFPTIGEKLVLTNLLCSKGVFL